MYSQLATGRRSEPSALQAALFDPQFGPSERGRAELRVSASYLEIYNEAPASAASCRGPGKARGSGGTPAALPLT